MNKIFDIKDIFSFSGYASRGVFAVRFLIIWISIFFIYVVADSTNNGILLFLIAILFLALIWANISNLWKRNKDVGNNPFAFFLIFIPVINFLFLIYLFFADTSPWRGGNEGEVMWEKEEGVIYSDDRKKMLEQELFELENLEKEEKEIEELENKIAALKKKKGIKTDPKPQLEDDIMKYIDDLYESIEVMGAGYGPQTRKTYEKEIISMRDILRLVRLGDESKLYNLEKKFINHKRLPIRKIENITEKKANLNINELNFQKDNIEEYFIEEIEGYISDLQDEVDLVGNLAQSSITEQEQQLARNKRYEKEIIDMQRLLRDVNYPTITLNQYRKMAFKFYKHKRLDTKVKSSKNWGQN